VYSEDSPNSGISARDSRFAERRDGGSVGFTSEATTRDVKIQVEPTYLPERSDPFRDHWFFAYRIRITNQGDEIVKLHSRHWIITDANGQIEEVIGPGVVGETPTLRPGEAFEYTSFCPLKTPFGTMHGNYQMTNDDGEEFDVEIPQFELSEPLPVN
jgi:ApaG protein